MSFCLMTVLNLGRIERKLNELVALASFVWVRRLISKIWSSYHMIHMMMWWWYDDDIMIIWWYDDYMMIITIWWSDRVLVMLLKRRHKWTFQWGNSYQLVILVVMVRNLKLKMSIFPNLRNWIWPETLEKIYSLVTMLVISSIIANRII